MATIPVPLLVISGPVGVGKTTVGYEVSTLLRRQGVFHSFVDLDVLAQTHPRPPDDRFGDRLALLNLRGMWVNCAAAGSRNLVVARVVETRQELERIQHAIFGAEPIICQLGAGDETLLMRVRQREVGSGLQWCEARALELAKSLRKNAPADFTIDTDNRSLPDIADEIIGLVAWAK